jgi:hypothetical protein
MPLRPLLSSEVPALPPAFRPTRREVKAYADVIRAADADRGRNERACLKQAELQLWAWRAEIRQPAPRRRRAPRGRDQQDFPGAMTDALPAF